MLRKQAIKLLQEIGQDKFLTIFDTLSPIEKEAISRQLLHIDPNLVEKMQQTLQPSPLQKEEYAPYQTSYRCGSIELQKIGRAALKNHQCGAIIVAGGQGSRLRFNGPKGCFPISLVKQKSLFQLFAEKCKAASLELGVHLPIAVMTSLENHAETCIFFAEHNFFGLQPMQVSFFVQPSLPALDKMRNLFLESRDRFSMAPNGNGAVFKAFVEEGIYRRWKERGVEYVTFSQIDNPLSDPFDAELIGLQITQNLDVGIKAIERENPDESVGLIVKKRSGQLGVVEYNEVPAEKMQQRDKDNRLLYSIANISSFCFSLPFMYEASLHSLPLHPAIKPLKYLNEEGKTVTPAEPNGWKFEQFVFDAFSFAKKIEAIIYPRENVFAPLKNYQGEDSIATVQAALFEADRKAFESVTGLSLSMMGVPHPFELSLDFHYPREELREAWRGKSLPQQDYISF